jgi:hypothetical protein
MAGENPLNDKSHEDDDAQSRHEKNKDDHVEPRNDKHEDVESAVDSKTAYELKGMPLLLVITGLAIAIFLMSLDSSIIATAIPRITTQFNSTGDIAWYGSAYSFSMCALQPISGKIFSSFALKVNYATPSDISCTGN